jgi:catechol 2,3-dioxygenase-like lactoylglutathione lyase family enzyme
VLRDYDLIAFVATLDASRARRFYEGVLGLDFVEDTPFALIFDANGTTLRIQKAELKPASYTVLGWRVPDIRTAIETLTARGVKFEPDGSGRESGLLKAGAKSLGSKTRMEI